MSIFMKKFSLSKMSEETVKVTEDHIICHDCHCHDEPILAQNKEQKPLEQNPQMDHDQTNEPSGPHEAHDGDEKGQIND